MFYVLVVVVVVVIVYVFVALAVSVLFLSSLFRPAFLPPLLRFASTFALLSLLALHDVFAGVRSDAKMLHLCFCLSVYRYFCLSVCLPACISTRECVSARTRECVCLIAMRERI